MDHRRISGCGSRRVAPPSECSQKNQGITDSTDQTNSTDRSLTPPLRTSPDESCSATLGCFWHAKGYANAMGVLLSKTSSRLVAHGAPPTEARSVESVSSVKSVPPGFPPRPQRFKKPPAASAKTKQPGGISRRAVSLQRAALNRRAACPSPGTPNILHELQYRPRETTSHCTCAQPGRGRGEDSRRYTKRSRCFDEAIAARA